MHQQVERAADQSGAAFPVLAEDPLALLLIGNALDLRKVRARRKSIARAREDHDASVLVVAHLVQQPFEFEHDLLVQRIALFGPVEGQGRDASLFFQDKMLGHVALLVVRHYARRSDRAWKIRKDSPTIARSRLLSMRDTRCPAKPQLDNESRRA